MTKSVFYGKFNETEVVLKWVAAPVDIFGFDHKPTNDNSNTHPFLNSVVERPSYKEQELRNVVLCPSHDNIHMLYRDLDLTGILKKKRSKLSLKNSIEVLLMQILPSEKNWPLPHYYGACKNIVVQEYKGNSLTATHSLQWKARALLGVQLLIAADKFTFQHPDFAFYFTDLSPDNLVVDASGKVSLVDLDNVIIVDKKAYTKGYQGQPGGWNDVHVSEMFNEIQLSFSTAEICSHHLSDHNYFAVCQHILIHSELMKGGLLHDVPNNIAAEYPQLQELLSECALPKKYRSRIEPGQNLKIVLENIVQDYVWDA